MITKLKHIIRGWWLVLVDTKESRLLNDTREQYCIECPFRNKSLNTCTDCGCFLPAKRRVIEEACPQFKW